MQAICELWRMLKPGGVLLAAVPQVHMVAPYWHDLWRWTSEGFHLQLAKFFGERKHHCSSVRQFFDCSRRYSGAGR